MADNRTLRIWRSVVSLKWKPHIKHHPQRCLWVCSLSISRCLERHTGVRLTDRNLTTTTHALAPPLTARHVGNAGVGGRPRSPIASDDATEHRMQWLADTIAAFVDEIGSKQTVSGLVVRVELEKMMRTVREVHCDVVRIRDAFRTTLKHKQKLEVEALSLLHCYQEIRRLEREIKVSKRNWCTCGDN